MSKFFVPAAVLLTIAGSGIAAAATPSPGELKIAAIEKEMANAEWPMA